MPRGIQRSGQTWKQAVHRVAVIDNEVLALGAHFAGLFGALRALVVNEIVEADGLRADVATLKVAMDGASGEIGCRPRQPAQISLEAGVRPASPATA